MRRLLRARATLVLAMGAVLLVGCLDPGRSTPTSRPTAELDASGPGSGSGKIEMTDAQWRERLSPEEYRITREQGTERAFTGLYVDTKTEGTYLCVCCGNPLFGSEHKYDSGSGWPSFWAPVEEGRVAERADSSVGMERAEIACSRCEAHLGHVFPDGPRPTGLRYCVNSASLRLEEGARSQPESSGAE